MSTELENYISGYFGVVQSQELENISKLFKLETIKKGDFFIESGKPCRQLGFIKSGLLRMFKFTDKKDVTQWVASPGSFVVDLDGFMFEKPSRWSIQALTDIDIYIISKKNYDNIGSIVPSWPQLEKLFMVRCFKTMEDRIFALLSMTAEERYQAFFTQNKELFNLVPQQYIASMLGMTPETFSRIRKKIS